MSKKETCGQCKFFVAEDSGRDSGCYKESEPFYRKANDPICLPAIEAWKEWEK